MIYCLINLLNTVEVEVVVVVEVEEEAVGGVVLLPCFLLFNTFLC